MPFGDLFKLPAGRTPPRSAPNRMAGLSFPQKLNYMMQFEGPSLMALGSGMMAGDTPTGFANMAKMQAFSQQDYAAEAEEDRVRAQTEQYLIANGIDPAQAKAASQNKDILGHIFNLEEEKVRAAHNASTYGTYGTPQWAFDEKTKKWRQYVITKEGGAKFIDTGEGVEPIPPGDVAAAKAAGAAVGTGAGEAQVQIPGAQMLVDDVKRISSGLLNDPYIRQVFGTIPMTGGWVGKKNLPNISPDARRVLGKLDELTGQSFLAARQLLKGGGQITDFEGRKADQAFSRIQSAEKYEDLAEAVAEFQYFVERGLEKLQRQANLQAAQPGAVPVTPAVTPPSLNQPASAVAPDATVPAPNQPHIPTYNPATGRIE